MVEGLSDIMQREWNINNNEMDDYNGGNTHHRRLLSRKPSDNNKNHHHQQSTNDDYDAASFAMLRVPKTTSNHPSSDTSYDTDGALAGTSVHRSKHHHRNKIEDFDYILSPRISIRKNGGSSSKPIAAIPVRQRLSHKTRTTAHASLNNLKAEVDREEEEVDARRRHLRLSTRVRQVPSSSAEHHAVQAVHLAPFTSHNNPIPAPLPNQPLRIIFMRHSERVNQALGPDWFHRAFRMNTYVPYDRNLPPYLPRRRFDQAYEFDSPLTANGLNSALHTGSTMMKQNLVVDLCLTSTALRCVQTCERVLKGMNRRERIPIRIEPGLFECPHVNHRIVDSFMTKKELLDNKFNIKHDYKPLVTKVTVPETLNDYFERSAFVMRGIIDRYAHPGGTILLVTHAPGLLALTDALKGLKPNSETFYRNVSLFPPLATCIAEYDGGKWKFFDQPFNSLSTVTQS